MATVASQGSASICGNMQPVETVARVLWPHREKLLPRKTQLEFAPMPGDPIWIMAAEVVAALANEPPT